MYGHFQFCMGYNRPEFGNISEVKKTGTGQGFDVLVQMHRLIKYNTQVS